MREFLEHLWNMPMATLGDQLTVGMYAAIIYLIPFSLFMAYKFWWKREG